MKSKCCHCLFRVGLQLSLDVGSVGGGHACFQSSCGLWRVAMLSSTRWCWQRPMYPPRWLQEGRILSPDPVKMADWKLFSGSRPHRSSLHVKKILFAGRYLVSLLFFSSTPSTTQVSVGSVGKGIRNHLLFITSAALDQERKHARSKSS